MDSTTPRLGWLSELQAKPTPVLVAGHAQVGTVDDLQELLNTESGFALRVSAMLALRVGNALHYVLVKGCADSQEPDKWQFPAIYCLDGEMPLMAARRALESALEARGPDFHGWGEARMDVHGPEFFYLTGSGLLRGTGRFVLNDRTLDFYYPVMLEVPRLDGLQLRARQPVAGWRGGSVRILPRREIFGMVGSGQLGACTERLCEIAEPSCAVRTAPMPLDLASDYRSLWQGEQLVESH